MNEPQVWTLIGVFAAGMFGMITVVSTLFLRTLRAELGIVRTELGADIASVRTELKSDIAGLRSDLRSLDRDVNALMKHTFGIDRD